MAGIDLLGAIKRLMHKDVNETFDPTTDSLEAIRDYLVASAAGVVTTYATGSQLTVIATEHFLSSPNVTGRFRLKLDLNTMAAGDVVEVRAYEMAIAAGTTRRAYLATYYGARPPDEIAVRTPEFWNALTDPNALRFSITQVTGAVQTIPWSVLRI